jgi:hypothetical protein
MIVVLPYCEKDATRMLELIGWMGELGKLERHQAVLIAAKPVPHEQTGVIYREAKAIFGDVQVVGQALADERGWPMSCNRLFAIATNYMAKRRQPWLWCEADCIPLKHGWIDLIESEYLASGKPFLGAVVGKPYPHLNGNAVYPGDLRTRCPWIVYADRVPWDLIRQHLVLPYARNSPLFQHEWGDVKTNTPPTFQDESSLAAIRPDACLFHRCKDGSLIRQLRSRMQLAHPINGFKSKLARGMQRWNEFKSKLKSPACVVCLGRNGDILNALPIAREISARQRRPVDFMVSTPYSGILDGCSYVNAIPVPLDYSKAPDAIDLAKETHRKIILAQVFGTVWNKPNCGVHYNRYAWSAAGYEGKWSDPRMKLVFDRRDPIRERALIRSHVKVQPKPMLLIGLEGLTSAFKDRGRFESQFIGICEERFQIVDLKHVKGDQLYDLLGLFDLATALVTVDTSFLHLAAATPRLRVAHLAPDNFWLESEPRCNRQFKTNYATWKSDMDRLGDWIGRVHGDWLNTRFFHAFEVHEPIGERIRNAQLSWPSLYEECGWRIRPYVDYARDARELGDPKAVPYLKDVLKHAMAGARAEDVIVFTNSDIALLPEVHKDILGGLSVAPVVLSSRRDVLSMRDMAPMPPVAEHTHCGRDLIAVRVWWLREHWKELPDAVLGRNDWDNCFLNIARRHCGCLVKGRWTEDSAKTITDCEMASGNVLHVAHQSDADSQFDLAGNVYNRALLAKWQREYCQDIDFYWAQKPLNDWEAGRISFGPMAPK